MRNYKRRGKQNKKVIGIKSSKLIETMSIINLKLWIWKGHDSLGIFHKQPLSEVASNKPNSFRLRAICMDLSLSLSLSPNDRFVKNQLEFLTLNFLENFIGTGQLKLKKIKKFIKLSIQKHHP